MFSDLESLKYPQRFAVSLHQMPSHQSRPTHFDLFLEKEDFLMSWILPAQLSDQMNTFVTPNRNHRKDYLDYEGPISQDRGTIHRVQQGRLLWKQSDKNLVEALLRLDNRTYTLTIDRIGEESSDPPNEQWRLQLKECEPESLH